MLRTHYAKELKAGKNITVAGWLHEKRVLGSIVFAVVRDFTGLVQITAKKGVTDDSIMELLKDLKRESVISVTGDAVDNKQAPNKLEILPKNINVISLAENLPIDISPGINTTLDKRLDWRSIDLRKPEHNAVFRVQSTLVQEMQLFLKKEGFVQVFTPSLMGSASESGAELFSVVYYDKEAFLRQDPQLHRQLSVAAGLERVYDVGPSWRAELSHTTRHLSEHRTIAAEMAFITDEYDVISLEEEMIRFAIERLVKDCRDELDILGIKLDVPKKKFPVLEFPDLYDVLKTLGEKVEYGKASYGSDGEKKLGEYVKNEFGSDFFFVNRFPFAEKPFYVMRVDKDPTWARSIDLIYKGMEMSSGGQREHRHDKLVQQLREKKMSMDSIRWFTDFFKFGVPPHGGFSIGIERLTMQILNLPNVREAVLFPRDVDRLTP